MQRCDSVVFFLSGLNTVTTLRTSLIVVLRGFVT